MYLGFARKLIVPFLKAFNGTDSSIEQFSKENILFVPGAKETLTFISSIIESFIISTSYKPYIKALCDLIPFPISHCYATSLAIDEYPIKKEEIKLLKKRAKDIVALPSFDLPSDISDPEEFSTELKEAIRFLDHLFWEEIPLMDIGVVYEKVNPVGGVEKLAAIYDSLKITGNRMEDLVYVGDSITDLEGLKKVKEAKGLSISFNGNRYAIIEAEIAVISAHTIVLELITKTFLNSGKKGVYQLIDDWGTFSGKGYPLDEDIIERMKKIFKNDLPFVELITKENQQEIIEKSESFRKELRGERIGALG